MKKYLIPTALAIIVLAMNCYPPIAHSEGEKTVQFQMLVLKNAQEYIEALRQDKAIDRHKSLPNLMLNNRPDPRAMDALGAELETGTRDMRVKIIKLLDEIRKLADPGHELRTPEVIALLVGPAFAKTDGARSNAMEMLYKYASVPTLSRYKDIFTKALKEKPTGDALILVAKAKPREAWEELERLSRLPEWNENDPESVSIRIARAALGDTKIEDVFLAEATHWENLGGAKGLGDALYRLAQIGTQRSLQAICRRIRTPLIDTVIRGDHSGEGTFEFATSGRLFVMDALRYAFPERPELDSYKLKNDEDYIKVEQFCTKKLGVSFNGVPRPEFFIRNY